MLDHYNGRLVYEKNEWQAEHVYTLKQAWLNGFEQLYKNDRAAAVIKMREFANDPDNLICVGGSSNMSRGSLSIWQWLPLNMAYIPKRNEIVRLMNERYGLKLTITQVWAMEFSDKKILKKYKNGFRLGKVRAWMLERGFHRFLMPF